MTNLEKIQYLRNWVESLKEEDPGKNNKKIESLNYAIRQCEKNESRRLNEQKKSRW